MWLRCAAGIVSWEAGEKKKTLQEANHASERGNEGENEVTPKGAPNTSPQ